MPGVLKVEGSQVLTGDGNGNLSWSSGVPPWTMLQVHQNQFTTFYSIYSTNTNQFYQFQDSNNNPLRTTISNCQSGSKILISCFLTFSINSTNRQAKFRLVDATNSDAIIGTEGSGGLFGHYDNYSNYGGIHISYEILYTPPSFSSGSFSVDLYGAINDPGETLSINDSHSGGTSIEVSSNIILKELAG